MNVTVTGVYRDSYITNHIQHNTEYSIVVVETPGVHITLRDVYDIVDSVAYLKYDVVSKPLWLL